MSLKKNESLYQAVCAGMLRFALCWLASLCDNCEGSILIMFDAALDLY